MNEFVFMWVGLWGGDVRIGVGYGYGDDKEGKKMGAERSLNTL